MQLEDGFAFEKELIKVERLEGEEKKEVEKLREENKIMILKKKEGVEVGYMRDVSEFSNGVQSAWK